jgi:tRNA pseudouridine synthase 10
VTTADAATRSRIDALVDAAIPRLVEVTSEFEFATFQTASRVPRALADAPEPEKESFRIEARLALLRRLEPMWPGRRLAAVGPDLKVTLLPESPKGVAVFVEPLLVAGRYRKLVRGMSQTGFHCRACRGRRGGCEACGGTRRRVAEAVEDFVKAPIAAALGARRSSFHGCGREDVDVRMLGAGRPFVVSVQWPRRRTIDAGAVERGVAERSGGRVTVSDLRVVGREEMRRVTTEHGAKTYRAVVRSASGTPLPADAAARLAPLSGAEIRQRTPERVERRRADKVRVRRVLAVGVVARETSGLVAVVRTEPGTYLKELVSGDGGRTSPSFAEVLGQPCFCEELDVLSADDAADGPIEPVVGGESAFGCAL